MRVIPSPKLLTSRRGHLPLGERVSIAAAGRAATRPAAWLAGQLEGTLTDDPAGAAIVLGLLPDLLSAGLAPESWAERDAFASALGREQGYVLSVTPERAVLGALEPAGLFHAAACLLQLAEPEGLRCAEVEDRPDFRFRVANWLLNVEINRWAYERGDGRDATLARLRCKIDLAERLRLNVIWFDGFGWDPHRTPDYAEIVREIARYARERGIRLAHAGYGGGYGFAYQRSALYSAPYMGRAYENRRPWPDGATYDCIGEPSYPESRHHGTCLSNAEMQDAKLAELTEFARACEPGMLYIHDIDSGRLAVAQEGWLQRCDNCRRAWPNDDATAPDGMAGAYAAWFRRMTDAIAPVRSDDDDYQGERDCELVFVGPVYTAATESDEDWDASCRYFETVSRLLGPAPNVQFGIREQLVSDREPRMRVAELAARLDAVGNGHGVFVAAFCGGDGYYSDQPLSPAPALNRYAMGARTIYSVNFGGAAEPAQVLAAEFAWNAEAPGAVEIAGSREEALAQLEASRSGALRPPEIYAPGGLLDEACEALYGPHAGRLVARALRGDGRLHWPIVAIWPSFSREVGKLAEVGSSACSARARYWEARVNATEAAANLVLEAERAQSLTDAQREDLKWLASRLHLGPPWHGLRDLTRDGVHTSPV